MHANKKLSAFVELERQVLTVKTTAGGEDALFSLTTGNNNTATGFEALFFNTSGSSNTTNGAGVLLSVAHRQTMNVTLQLGRCPRYASMTH